MHPDIVVGGSYQSVKDMLNPRNHSFKAVIIQILDATFLHYMVMLRFIAIFFVTIFTQSIYGQIELVKDIFPEGSGIGGSELVVFKDELYFIGRIGHSDRELYKSDGSAAGTQIVADIRENGGSSPDMLTPAGDYLYFLAFNNPTNEELYRTDGTTAGTEMVADLYPGGSDPNISNLTAVGNKLFFTGNDGVYGTELYVVEGTGIPARLTDFRTGSSNAIFIELVAYNGLLFFSSESDTDTVGFELYVSDGTVEGTQLFKDLYPGTGNHGAPQNYSVIGDKLFFSARDEAGEEPWISDGTPGGTFRIADVYPGSEGSGPRYFTGANPGKVFFSATGEGVGNELFITNGTEAGTALLKDINTEENFSSSPELFTLAGDHLYFAAYNPDTGSELYFSDGTPGGTYLVGDLNPGPGGADFFGDCMAWYDSTFFFGGDNGTTGRELWAVVNDTIPDQPLQDLYPGSSDSRPGSFVMYKDSLFFFATGLEGRELHKMGPFDPCQGVLCPVGQVCVDGTCIDPDPDPGPDPDDPCEGVYCPAGQVCYDGECSLPFGSFYGVVTDDSTGLPLEDVFVYQIDGSDTIFSTYTNADGFYAIVAFLNSFDLNFSKNGYAKENTNLTFASQTDSLNIGLSTDLCSGVACPVGQVCYDGSCYEPVQEYAGRVMDPSGTPIVGARVEDPATGIGVFTDDSGTFHVDNTYQSIIITKDGYSPVYRQIVDNKNLYIFMHYLPCLSMDCPEGFVCKGGACYPPGDPVYATISAHAMDGTELSGIEVTELGTVNSFVLNGPTEIYLSTENPHLVFTDANNNYTTEILPFIAGQEKYYLKQLAGCEGVFCPAGDVCYEGVCYSPDELYEFSGFVTDNDSIPLSHVRVTTPLNTFTNTGLNGFFSVSIPFHTDSLLLRFDKTDYNAIGKYVYSGSDNFVSMNMLDLCIGVTCPPDQVCYMGSCYSANYEPYTDACEGVYCPVGQVCYEGSCYDPCYLDANLCHNSGNPCQDVNCPVGQVCYEGSCYDPCILDDSINGPDCTVYEDPCDAITVQPGYICQDGVLIPKCPENALACAVSDPCGVINCPPGEDCFQCFDATGYNNSGTALIQGILKDGLLKSLNKAAQMEKQDVFIYLQDAETGRNVAISKTDEEGQFSMDNLPAAEYLLYAMIPGYFITEEEQRFTVANGDKLQMDISAEDVFLQLSITPLTSAGEVLPGHNTAWYPSPGDGSRFYIDDTGRLDFVVLYDIAGKKISTSVNGETGSTVELSVRQKLEPGFYIIRWKNENDQYPKSQTLLVN